MSLGIRLVPLLAYRIFFINRSFEHIYNTYFYVRFILLLFNPIQSSPNNLKSDKLDSTQVCSFYFYQPDLFDLVDKLFNCCCNGLLPGYLKPNLTA